MRFVGQRLREIAFILLSIPVSAMLMSIVFIGMDSGTFLPVAVLLFLGLLTLMEWVAKFEVRRTNWVLGTDFAVVDNWFGQPFFSWAGVKERITSLRSWMAIAYVFGAFGFSVLGLLFLGLIAVSVFIMLVASGVLPNTGQWAFDGSPDLIIGNLQLFFIELPVGGLDWASWDLSEQQSLRIALGIAVALLPLSMYAMPRLARGLAELVEGLLSGTQLQVFENAIKQLKRGERVSERQVRDAFEQEPVREQLADLSRREREILALMAQGKSNAGIAKSLYITEGSVEKHVSNILSKLGLRVEPDDHRRVLAVLAYLGIDSRAD